MFGATWRLEICALRRMGARRYDEALGCYRRMMERVQPTAYHWEMMAQCYEWIGETENAERAARRALEAEENSIDALRLLARLSIAQGHYAQAHDYVRKALALRRKSDLYPTSFPSLVMRLLGRLPGQGSFVGETRMLRGRPSTGEDPWYQWAREFLVDYEQIFGRQSSVRPC